MNVTTYQVASTRTTLSLCPRHVGLDDSPVGEAHDGYCDVCDAEAEARDEAAWAAEQHRMRHIPECDRCGKRGSYERGAHHTRLVPVNDEMEWDVFPICDACAVARGDANR